MQQLEHVGNSKGSTNRVEALREDLRMAVAKVHPRAGDIIFLKPKNDSIEISAQFAAFLADSLKQVIPPGVGLVIMPTADFSVFRSIKEPDYKKATESVEEYPSNPEDSYLYGFSQGWHIAREQIVEALNV